MARRRTAAKYIGAGVAISMLLLLLGVLVLTNTDWGRDRVRGFMLDRLAGSLDGRIHIGSVGGNLLRRITLVDVRIDDVQGRPFLRADTVAARFSLRGLLRQRIALTDVRLVRAIVVLDEPPGEDWNYVRIFRIEPDPEPGPPGWGDWVSLHDVDLVESRVTVRSTWAPADDLSPAERARAVQLALSGEKRDNIVAVPGGYQNVMDFRQLNARLPVVIPAHPDSAGIPIEIARFSGVVQPFRPPPARVDDLAGRFRLERDTLHFTEVQARMPGSALGAAGSYALSSGDLLLRLNGAPLALADMRWLYPQLPEEGGGDVRLMVSTKPLATHIVAEDMDLASGGATLAGRIDVTTGDTLRLGDTDIRFTRIGTALLRDLSADFAFPRTGTFTGRLAVSGPRHALQIDGDVSFDDDAGPTSRVIADGELGVRPTWRFGQMRMEFRPLHTQLVRAFAPEFPLRGVVTGFANLTGTTELLQLDSDLTLVDPATGRSRVLARGGIDQRQELRLDNLLVRMSPLRTDLIRDALPVLPAAGTIVGQFRVDGVPRRALHIDGDVELTDPQSGVSSFGATGGVNFAGELRFADLDVRLHSVQLDLLRPHLPELPPGGTVAGAVRLDGAPRGMLEVDGDIAHVDPRLGTSRVGLTGGIALFAEPIRFRNLDVRMDPLQLALVRGFVPELPLGGVMAGRARVDGSTDRFTARGNVVHDEAGHHSHLAGSVEVATGPGGWALADLQLQPLALGTVGRFIPEAGLRGSVAGTLRARGRMDDLQLNADLRVAGGGAIRVDGWLNAATAQPAYDLRTRTDAFNIAAVTTRTPVVTSLTGRLDARGRGTDPATMSTAISADLIDLQVDEVAADRVLTELRIDGGLAVVDTGFVRLGTAHAELHGSFGLVDGRYGELSYVVRADSLHAFAGWVPGADTAVTPSPTRTLLAADTAVVDTAAFVQQPRVAADTVVSGVTAPVAQRPAFPGGSREVHSVTVADISPMVHEPETPATDSLDRGPQIVLRQPADAAPDTLASDTLPLDTLPADPPADSIAGSLRAEGTLRGNIARFDADGRAEVENLVFRGSRVADGVVEYAMRDVRTAVADIDVDASLRGVRVAGMSFDSVDVDASYRGDRFGEGRAVIVAHQDDDTDYRADVAFTLSLERSELRVADAELRFDTVTWRTTQPGVIGWGRGAVEVENLEVVSDAGGRIFADGILPVDGQADLALRVDELQLAQLAVLFQHDEELEGVLDLDVRITGTQRAPRITGTAALRDAVRDGAALPDIRSTVDYADQLLVAVAELMADDGRVLATADARLPMDLALAGAGPRLLTGPIRVDISADSLPADMLPALTDQVEDVSGYLAGNISITGTFDAPVIDGTATVELASAHVVPLGVRFDEITGSLTMAGSVVTVDSIVAWSRGPVRLTGDIDIANLDEPVFDLLLAADNSRIINTDDAELRVDADVTITGPLLALQVRGDVHVRSGVIYVPETGELGSTNMVNLDDPGTFDRTGGALDELRPRRREQPQILENAQVDVGIIIDRDVWARSTEANIEIYTPPELGPLRVRSDALASGVVMEGSISTDRGEYEFLGRRFRMTRGAVTFMGESPINPVLQVAAEHEVRLPGREALQIRIVLGGTFDDLEISLESTAQPPLSQTDLLSYLAFGRDASSLLLQQGSSLSGQGSGAGDLVGTVAGFATQQLAAVAIEAGVSEIEREVAREFGLDVFRITPADMPAEVFTGSYADVLRGTEIEAGSYIRPRLFVAGQARGGRPGVRLEYRTPRGYEWTAAWQPRYLPVEPTLEDLSPSRIGVLGSFLFREWRF